MSLSGPHQREEEGVGIVLRHEIEKKLKVTFVATCMDLEDIMFHETCQTPKGTK